MTRLRRQLRHQLPLFTYVILTVVVVLALAGYTRHIRGELDKADQVSCHDRKILLSNQRLVLRYLHSTAPRTQIDPRTGKPWFLEFAKRIPSTVPPLCK